LKFPLEQIIRILVNNITSGRVINECNKGVNNRQGHKQQTIHINLNDNKFNVEEI